MENKTNIITNHNIKFIHREKNVTFGDKIRNIRDQIKLLFIYKAYKDEKIPFKLIYDKIYRKEAYNLIINGSQHNMHLARNIYSTNEDKYPFRVIEKEILDDETYAQNMFLDKVVSNYFKYKLSSYLIIPFGTATIVFKFVMRNNNLFILSTLFSTILFLYNLRSFRNKENAYLKGLVTLIEEELKDELNLYKNFFIENELNI